MVSYKPLWYYVLDLVKNKKIYVSKNRLLRKNFFYVNPLQALLVDMLIYREGLGIGKIKGRVIIEKDYNNEKIVFLGRKGEVESEIIYPGKDVIYEDIERILPSKPLFLVLNSLYHEHTLSDRKRLGLQLGLMVNVVRRWLWDRHLVFVDTPQELISVIEKHAKPNRVLYLTRQEVCNIINDTKHVVALDPYAEEALNEKVVLNSSIFIIGGIVDRDKPLKKATTKLINMLEKECNLSINSYHIEIDGIKMAVPHRLNRVLEILLKVLIDRMTLREAVISVMTNRDIAWYIGLMLVKGETKLDEIIAEIERIIGRKISREVIHRAKRIAGLGV
ncbi:hypothetical protein J4526_02915 [Desulfurococcaceae archaeon MEX13E-LK6-19]|nr:hypothetical protein J4526_02915 [Desulfurococcaceae archaeon MEX13E-LK6-19]